MMAIFRLMQGGIEVVSVSGPILERAYREIWRYAEQYVEDGPVEIQEKVQSRWVSRKTLEMRENADRRD